MDSKKGTQFSPQFCLGSPQQWACDPHALCTPFSCYCYAIG